MIDQVLKIDASNAKALIRKCHVLIELGKPDDCNSLLGRIEEVAFQSDKSQLLYNEIKDIRERIKDPAAWRANQTKI